MSYSDPRVLRRGRALLLVFALAFLTTCGGGSGSGGGGGNSNPGGAGALLTPQERSTSIGAIDAQFASLPGVDVVADNQALAQFIASRPEFTAAGTADGGLTVWAIWRDGVQYLIVRNREIPAPTVISPTFAVGASASVVRKALSGAASARSSFKVALSHGRSAANVTAPESGHPSNLPGSNQVRLLSAMGPGFADIRPTLRTWFLQQQYEEVPADATVESLKTVGGDGVFYLSTHGGNGSGTYALATATQWSEVNADNYKDDLKAGRLVIMKACFDGQVGCSKEAHPESYEKHYGITPQFIAEYWGNFADHSLVFLDACSTNSGASTALVLALAGKSANIVMGWDGDVADADGGASALYVFDRLFGSNGFRPQKTKTGYNQRPFDWVAVLDDCRKNGGLCMSQGAELQAYEAIPGCAASGACDQTFGLLAPSIREMWPYESPLPGSGASGDLLFIAGFFGQDPGSGPFDPARGVSIGGTDVPVLVWNPIMIVVALPHSGAGVAGDVIVRVHDHTSNTAQLTEWKVPYTFTLDDFQKLKQTVTLNAHFRADIRRNVQVIGEPPVEPTGLLPPLPAGTPPLPPGLPFNVMLNDSSGTYQCSGNATQTANNQTSTELWNDSGSISYTTVQGAADAALDVQDSVTMVLSLPDWQKTCASTIDGKPLVTNVLRPGEVLPLNQTPIDGKITMLPDAQGLIGAATYPGTTFSHSALGGGATVTNKLSWPDTPPLTGAPDPNSAR